MELVVVLRLQEDGLLPSYFGATAVRGSGHRGYDVPPETIYAEASTNTYDAHAIHICPGWLNAAQL